MSAAIGGSMTLFSGLERPMASCFTYSELRSVFGHYSYPDTVEIRISICQYE